MTKKIVIASILKPVDDVRAYWKIAQSMAKTNKYAVNIIGNIGKKESNHPKIAFHQNQISRKQLLKRVTIRYRILLLVLKIRPSIFILTTHELILVSLIIRFWTRCKIIYDVQENYSINAHLNSGFLSIVYSLLISFKEKIASYWIDHYWLAEKCYSNELSFEKNNFTIVQNKAFYLPINRKPTHRIRMLFSGTISHYSGALIALKIMKKIVAEAPGSEGVFIGQVHDPDLYFLLENESKKLKEIKVILSSNPIAYNQILAQIEWANLGIISYLPNRINQNKIPTKLYEYSRYKMPYLVQKNTLWSKVGSRLGGQIPVGLANPDLSKVFEKLENTTDLFPIEYPPQDTWESESKKVIDSIHNLLKIS